MNSGVEHGISPPFRRYFAPCRAHWAASGRSGLPTDGLAKMRLASVNRYLRPEMEASFAEVAEWISITPDDPAGRGRIQAARIRQAAVDAGIGPDNALAPFVAAIAQATEEIIEAPGEVDERIAPMLAEMRRFYEAASQAASRPLVTEHQLKWTVLPAPPGSA